MQERKITDKMSGVENAGQENDGQQQKMNTVYVIFMGYLPTARNNPTAV